MTGDVHINRGVNRLYICRVRMPRARKWRVLPGEYPERMGAFVALAIAMAESHKLIGEVLLTMDCYDPIVVVRVSR